MARAAQQQGDAGAGRQRGSGSGVVLCVGLGSGTLPAFWSWHDPTACVQARAAYPLVPLSLPCSPCLQPFLPLLFAE